MLSLFLIIILLLSLITLIITFVAGFLIFALKDSSSNNNEITYIGLTKLFRKYNAIYGITCIADIVVYI